MPLQFQYAGEVKRTETGGGGGGEGGGCGADGGEVGGGPSGGCMGGGSVGDGGGVGGGGVGIGGVGGGAGGRRGEGCGQDGGGKGGEAGNGAGEGEGGGDIGGGGVRGGIGEKGCGELVDGMCWSVDESVAPASVSPKIETAPSVETAPRKMSAYAIRHRVGRRSLESSSNNGAVLSLLCLDSRPGSISLSALCLEPRVHDESSTSLRRCAYLELPKESCFARSMSAGAA